MKVPRKQIDVEALARKLHDRMLTEMAAHTDVPLSPDHIAKNWEERPVIPKLWKAVAEEAVACLTK